MVYKELPSCATLPAWCHAIGYRDGTTDSPLGQSISTSGEPPTKKIQDSNNATLFGMVFVAGDTKPRGVLTRSFIDLVSLQ